jgi:uncharacterized membrane protein
MSLLSPVIGAGFMIGCQEQNDGGDFRVAHLFSGFQQNFGQLVLVGVIYLGAMVAIGIITAIIMGGTLAAMGGMDPMATQDPAAVPHAVDSASILLPLLIAMALILPVVMAYWFAPVLVALQGLSAVEAMKLSFSACVKNILPFLVYGLITFVLFFIAAIPFFLGLLVLIPVLTASIYTAYRDIFRI